MAKYRLAAERMKADLTKPELLRNTRDLLDAARRGAHRNEINGQVTAYCRNVSCSVRDVWIFVKEYDVRTPSNLRCPARGRTLTVHGVER
ncbi:MAG: hypothetical protein ACE5MG_10020 [Candidatus Methylomirabilales bacterium]